MQQLQARGIPAVPPGAQVIRPEADVQLRQDAFVWQIQEAIKTFTRATRDCLRELADQQAQAVVEVARGATEVLGWLALLAVSDAWVQQRLPHAPPGLHFQHLWNPDAITVALEEPAGLEIVEARLGQRPAVVRLHDDGMTLHSPQQVQLGGLETGLHPADAEAARRPLLIRGEPGTGKSQLAHAAAVARQRLFLSVVVHARTIAQDLQWQFDAVARLGEAQLLAQAHDPQARQHLQPQLFLSPGPLWWALDWDSAQAQWQACTRGDVVAPAGG